MHLAGRTSRVVHRQMLLSIMSLMWLCLADEEINHGYLYIHVRTYLATNTSYWNWSTCLGSQLSYVHMRLIFISFSLSKTLDLLIISLLMSFHLMVFSSFCPRIFEMAPLRRSRDGGAKSYFLGHTRQRRAHLATGNMRQLHKTMAMSASFNPATASLQMSLVHTSGIFVPNRCTLFFISETRCVLHACLMAMYLCTDEFIGQGFS